MSKRPELVRGVLDISHGEAIWLGGDPCISLPAGHPAVTLHMADVRRAARWKAEAKRLMKYMKVIADARPDQVSDLVRAIAVGAIKRKP